MYIIKNKSLLKLNWNLRKQSNYMKILILDVSLLREKRHQFKLKKVLSKKLKSKLNWLLRKIKYLDLEMTLVKTHSLFLLLEVLLEKKFMWI